MLERVMTPRLILVGNEIVQWAQEYIAKEHPKMRRPHGSTAICPFVEKAIQNDTLYLDFHPEVLGRDEEELERVVLSSGEGFLRLGPFGRDQIKKAMLIIFPNIPEKETEVLDAAHAMLKPLFVEKGLMIGQFHKLCTEKSCHNHGFRVSTSPYPLMAIRHMAIHDILFLGGSKQWFTEYNLRFGEVFRRPDELEEHDRHLAQVYFDAKERWQG